MPEPETQPSFTRVERRLLDFLRVPPLPEAPEGSPESIRIFHAGRNYFKWSILLWAIANASFLLLLVMLDFSFGRLIARLPDWMRTYWVLLIWFEFLAFGLSLPFTFLARKLDYQLRWYVVTDRSLRIRSGIFSIEELTMTFSNIQEIRVNAGPLQKVLGLADVEVQSAGGGSGASGHVGRFEGVSNANDIRDLMVARLRKYRDSGLGEHDAAMPVASPMESESAAREVLAEARALRAALAR
ncbi:MAG: PH domain-containing protein [Bryobacteraceae bacterium]